MLEAQFSNGHMFPSVFLHHLMPERKGKSWIRTQPLRLESQSSYHYLIASWTLDSHYLLRSINQLSTWKCASILLYQIVLMYHYPIICSYLNSRKVFRTGLSACSVPIQVNLRTDFNLAFFFLPSFYLIPENLTPLLF